MISLITVNDKKYDKWEMRIIWGDFIIHSQGRVRTGIAPFIEFKLDDNYLGVEFTFSKDMFNNLKIGEKTNIKKYISDITYEDENGWITINDGDYDCDIKRIDETNFHIDFHVLGNFEDDEYDITIDDDIKIL